MSIFRTILPFAGDAPNVLKYIAADERSGNGDPGEADLELWIVTDYVEKGTYFFIFDNAHSLPFRFIE